MECSKCHKDYLASVLLIQDGVQHMICSCGNVDIIPVPVIGNGSEK